MDVGDLKASFWAENMRNGEVWMCYREGMNFWREWLCIVYEWE